MKPSAWANPKVQDLAFRLGSQAFAAGLLECLWKVTGDEDNEGGTATWKRVMQLAGPAFREVISPDDALRALVESDLVEDLGGGSLRVGGWRKHRPDYLRKRENEAKRAKSKRSTPAETSANRRKAAEESEGLDHVASSPSLPSPSSEGRDRRDPSRQSATAREEPERNPHEPQEAAPPERRTLLGEEHERLAAVIVRELDEARGHAPASSDRPADLSRLAQLCRQHGAAALQVARRYVADEHPSTAAKTVRELLGCWDRMRGLVDRPAATASRRGGRGYDQLDPEIVALYAEEG